MLSMLSDAELFYNPIEDCSKLRYLHSILSSVITHLRLVLQTLRKMKANSCWLERKSLLDYNLQCDALRKQRRWLENSVSTPFNQMLS